MEPPTTKSTTPAAPPNLPSSQSGKGPIIVLMLGMAGSGKTTLMQRVCLHAKQNNKRFYVINLDPAVKTVNYPINIDIRDTVKYKEVMKQHGLGPNGAILTSLNLFTTKFHQVLNLIEKRAAELDYIFIDTPGQIEVFTWSASGSIITETLASLFPTVLCYVIDTPRSTNPSTFMSNMLYACSILYKSKLPFVLALNKTDVVSHEFLIKWMTDDEAFQKAAQRDTSYMSTLTRSMSTVLDEFYKNLPCIGVSAVSGDGATALFVAFAKAAEDWVQYFQELQDRKLRANQHEQARQKESLTRLKQDLEENCGFDVVMSAEKRSQSPKTSDSHPDQDEMSFE